MTAIDFLRAVVLPAVLSAHDSRECVYTWRGIMTMTAVVWQVKDGR